MSITDNEDKKQSTHSANVGNKNSRDNKELEKKSEGLFSNPSWLKEFEPSVFLKWKKDNVYKINENSIKPLYSIDTPPPYVNTPIHMGHAVTYSLMDMFARFKRMTGFEVLFPLGLDRNGLPIEMAAEKRFGKKFNEVSREEFLLSCKQMLEETSAESTDSFMKLGISFNSFDIGTNIGDVYQTDSDDYRALTQATFIDMWNKGLIYEADRVNNYCPGCQTTIADAEIQYADRPTLFSDVTFEIDGSNEKLTIGTTRPEFLCSCEMIIYNPEDKRYTHLNGKQAIIPIYGNKVPIMAHPMADMEMGTGLVMMCAFGDSTDVRFFREQNLTPKISINLDGTMNDHAGFVKGLYIKKARTAILERLKEENRIVKQVQIQHRTPVCERSKDPIEFVGMKEFYVKQVEFKEKVMSLTEDLNFFAEESKQIMRDWINSVSIDWPISRRRYYATEVPLWYCEKCNEPIVPKPGRYYQPWRDDCPEPKCKKCNHSKFIGEVRVFDTWFDSSISPLYILGWKRHPEFYKKNNVCTLRPQGKEIIRTWLYYTVLKCWHLTGELIFRDAWINYHVVDGKGIKMSKSLGNIVNPQEVLQKYGAESFRLWCAVEGDIAKDDMRCSFDRIEGSGKTLNKLWNVAKFVKMFDDPKGEVRLCESDKWILTELNRIITLSNEHFEKYDFHTPALEIKHFLWETFASHYLELVKPRVYNVDSKFLVEEQNGALHTTRVCIESMVLLLAPIIPIITEILYTELTGNNVHEQSFPKPMHNHKSCFTIDDIAELNKMIWKAKKDKGLSLKATIKSLRIDKRFESIGKDLIAAHSIEELAWADKVEIIL